MEGIYCNCPRIFKLNGLELLHVLRNYLNAKFDFT